MGHGECWRFLCCCVPGALAAPLLREGCRRSLSLAQVQAPRHAGPWPGSGVPVPGISCPFPIPAEPAVILFFPRVGAD